MAVSVTPEQAAAAFSLFMLGAGIIFLLLLAVYAVAAVGIIKNTKRKGDE